jgi:hypothetical protein
LPEDFLTQECSLILTAHNPYSKTKCSTSKLVIFLSVKGDIVELLSLARRAMAIVGDTGYCDQLVSFSLR